MKITAEEIYFMYIHIYIYIYIYRFTIGFDLTTHDWYFAILVEVFMNHILAENRYFTNYRE